MQAGNFSGKAENREHACLLTHSYSSLLTKDHGQKDSAGTLQLEPNAANLLVSPARIVAWTLPNADVWEKIRKLRKLVN